jgi:hypothetical protein
MATVDAMRVANKEMKKQYKGIDIDKIEVSPPISSQLSRADVTEHPLRYGRYDRASQRDPRIPRKKLRCT